MPFAVTVNVMLKLSNHSYDYTPTDTPNWTPFSAITINNCTISLITFNHPKFSVISRSKKIKNLIKQITIVIFFLSFIFCQQVVTDDRLNQLRLTACFPKQEEGNLR